VFSEGAAVFYPIPSVERFFHCNGGGIDVQPSGEGSIRSAFVKTTGSRLAELACFFCAKITVFYQNSLPSLPKHAAFPETGHLH
jgi:hypothetical protein